jgi:aspartyl-tRNA synthetase
VIQILQSLRSSIAKGSCVRAIPATGAAALPRSFYDKMIEFAISEGAGGLGYIQFTEEGEAKGPIAKFLDNKKLEQLKSICSLKMGMRYFSHVMKNPRLQN